MDGIGKALALSVFKVSMQHLIASDVVVPQIWCNAFEVLIIIDLHGALVFIVLYDIAQLCKEILEIPFAPEVIDYVHFHSCGNLRKVMKLIHSVEEMGIKQHLSQVNQTDLPK